MKLGLSLDTNEDIEIVMAELNRIKAKAIKGFGEVAEMKDGFQIVKKDIKISFQVSKLNSREYAIFQMIR